MGSSIGTVRHADQVVGPDGSILTEPDLPPKNLRRWVARRKAEIVAAVEGGLLTDCEACARYNISREEFSTWMSAYDAGGVPGLRARVLYRMTMAQTRSGEAARIAGEDIHHTGPD